MKTSHTASPARTLLFAVDAFTALTAGGGGIALVAGLERDGFPRDLLEGTPFSSYMIPGLILTGAVGGSAIVAALATLRRPDAGAIASVAAGAIMMGWITGEVLILNQPSAITWIEVAYFATGLATAGLGLAVGRTQKRLRFSLRGK
ncbi:MAG: hypothetical protein ACXWQZ_01540 [Ktedonobacterales bacterium]